MKKHGLVLFAMLTVLLLVGSVMPALADTGTGNASGTSAVSQAVSPASDSTQPVSGQQGNINFTPAAANSDVTQAPASSQPSQPASSSASGSGQGSSVPASTVSPSSPAPTSSPTQSSGSQDNTASQGSSLNIPQSLDVKPISLTDFGNIVMAKLAEIVAFLRRIAGPIMYVGIVIGAFILMAPFKSPLKKYAGWSTIVTALLAYLLIIYAPVLLGLARGMAGP